jgi:hypothetical protein
MVSLTFHIGQLIQESRSGSEKKIAESAEDLLHEKYPGVSAC